MYKKKLENKGVMRTEKKTAAPMKPSKAAKAPKAKAAAKKSK